MMDRGMRGWMRLPCSNRPKRVAGISSTKGGAHLTRRGDPPDISHGPSSHLYLLHQQIYRLYHHHDWRIHLSTRFGSEEYTAASAMMSKILVKVDGDFVEYIEIVGEERGFEGLSGGV